MTQGVIVKALSGFYQVSCAGGGSVTCRARGKFRHEGEKPLVGDRVRICVREDNTGTVEGILPRKNAFTRPAVANLELLVIIASGAVPVTDPFLIDRLTAIAGLRGCACAVCFNKWDLEQPVRLFETYRDAGFPALRVSARTGEGVEELRALTAGKLCAFTGNSGVGKSSILNALDRTLALPVGGVSEKLGRGRHTTRHVELFGLDNGALIADTPGFSAFEEDDGAAGCPPEELQYAFQEFAPYRGECRFPDCAHVKEKGCAVLAAVAAGRIGRSRHASYVRLYEAAREVPQWQRKGPP